MARTYLEALDEMRQQEQNPTPFLSSQPQAPTSQPATPKKKQFRTYLEALADLPAPAPKAPVKPLTEPEPLGQRILNALPLDAIQKYAIDPLDKVAQFGAEAGKGFAEPLPYSASVAARSGQIVPAEPVSPAEQGIREAAGELVGSTLADPRNLPFLLSGGAANPIAKRAIAAGFAALMGKGSVEAAGQYGASMDQPVPESEKARLATHAIVSPFLAGMAGAGIGERKPVEAAPVEAAPAIPAGGVRMVNAELKRAAPEVQPAAPQTAQPAITPEETASLEQAQARPEVATKPKLQEGMAVPAQITPQQVAKIEQAGFKIGEDGKLHRAETQRVGQEHPQIEAQVPGKPVASAPPAEQPEVHPNYEQIGIDADTRQPILKAKVTETPQSPQEAPVGEVQAKPQPLVQGQQEAPKALEGQPPQALSGPPQFTSGNQPGLNYSADELTALKAKHGIAEVKPQMVGAEAKAATPAEGYGSQNKLFTKEKADAARKRFSAKASKLSSGIDPSALPDLIEVGGYHFEAGARDFAKWSAEMVKQLGEAIKPHLQRIWDSVRERFGEKAPSFYSQSERVIQAKMPSAASGEQILGILRNEVTPDELKWSGIEDYLKSKPKFTKQEVQDFIRQNNVQVKEVVKGERRPSLSPAEEDRYFELKDKAQGDTGSFGDLLTPAEKREYAALDKRFIGGSARPTKFQNYQLPGGKNYRELLLTLPAKETPQPPFEWRKGRTGWAYFSGDKQVSGAFPSEDYKERAFATISSEKSRDTENFRSSHFDEPNVLAHVRFNDRWTSADGTSHTPPQKVLFLEEVQSDWAQKGRRQGFREGELQVPEQQVRPLSDSQWEISNALTRPGTNTTALVTRWKGSGWEEGGTPFPNGGKGYRATFQNKAKEFDGLEDAIAWAKEQQAKILPSLAKSEDHRVPDMPFKTNWHELALKRMLRWAAENGYDKLAWTTGEQQAGRYDLSKQVDKLYYKRQKGGEYSIQVKPKGSQHIEKLGDYPESKLPDVVGKDVADRMIKNVGEVSDMPLVRGFRELVEGDLRVGGEGMKGFYDKILPDFLNKYGKKWGAKVGESKIDAAPENSVNRVPSDTESVHSLDITPAMKADLLTAGQPLQGNKLIPPEKFAVKNLTPDELARLNAARQRFNDKVSRSSAGVDPTAVADLLEIGYYHFKSGARTLAAWSKAMIQELGEEFRPYVKSVWDELQKKLADGEVLTAKAPAKKAETGVPFLSSEPESKTASAAPPFLSTPKKIATGLPEPEKFAGNINLEKLSGPEQVIRVIKQTAKDFAPELEKSRRGVISNQETKAAAKRLVEGGLFTEKDLANIKKGSTLNAEQMNAARGILLDISGDVAKAAKDYEKNDSSENLLKLEALKYRQIAIQRSVSGATAEAGRALQSFKIIAKALREKSVSNYQKVLDQMGGKEVTEAVARSLAAIPENDIIGLNQFLRNHAKFTTADKVYAYYVANILSGRAQVRNFIGNQLFGIIQPAIRAQAGLLDRPLSAIFGRERKVYARETIPATLAYFAGIPEGARKAAYIIKNGFDLQTAQDLRVPSSYEFKGGVLNPFNHPGRWMLAADVLSKTMHFQAELTALATRQGIREGLSGGRLVERTNEILKNPTPEMTEKAIEFSRWATFNGRPDRIARSLIGARAAIPGGRFIQPFLSTPYNIIRTSTFDLTPAGLSQLASKGVRASEDSSLITAKALVGAEVLGIAAILAYNNKLTAAAPTDQAQKDAFFRAGKQPFSVKIGNRWVAYNQILGPFAPHFAGAAAMSDAFKQHGDVPTEDKLAQAAGAIGKSLLDASFFKGLSDLLEGINDPEKGLGDVVTNFAQGMVPFSGLLRVAAESQDPTIRDTKAAQDKIRSGIPFLSKDAPAKLDSRGREVQRRGGEGALAFLPSRIPVDEPVDAVDAELTKLGVTLGRASSNITIGREKYQLDRDQLRNLQESEGELISTRLEKLFASDSYQGMTDERKQRAASYVAREARDAARMQYVRGLRESNVQLTPKAKVQPYFLGAQPE